MDTPDVSLADGTRAADREGVREQGLVRVRGARDHNLKDVDVDLPRDALVVFSGVSGSGKSSLAFSTLYAEAQRRYFESVSPYARRLIDQVGVPDVDSIEGLPPAVALQQQRGVASMRSSVGSISTISNSLRILYSRAGKYPRGKPALHAEDFSPNTPQGACPKCHGSGHSYAVSEKSMVPDDSLSIRERAIAAWPAAWQGQNLRDILVSLGFNIDVPWRKMPKKDRQWILFTDEQPTVPVYAGFTPAETRDALRRKMEPSYQGTFMGVRKYVLHTFANTQSALMKKRVMRFMSATLCPTCRGKRLKRDALAVSFAGYDIAGLAHLSCNELADLLKTAAAAGDGLSAEKHIAARRIAKNVIERIATLQELGLGYLSLERATPTLSPGELQRLRLATQIRSGLFGVVYVLDEPSAGLHPADTESLLRALDQLKASGNSLFVVEHDLDVMRRAEWIIDVGPGAGEMGGEVLYSGPLEGLRKVVASRTADYLFGEIPARAKQPRPAQGWLTLSGIHRNNLAGIDAAFPVGALTVVTGVSGSGKSSLVSQALIELAAARLGRGVRAEPEDEIDLAAMAFKCEPVRGSISGIQAFDRLVTVNQKPIGRTPRSNLATYTGLFDEVRRLFAATKAAKARHYTASRFSFNVAEGRCPTCEGEGFVCVELLFMPSVYAPCPSCHGGRYNEATLAVTYRGKNIAEVLTMSVDQAHEFFVDDASVYRSLQLLCNIGLGYLRLGQPATELSGGEAQRIKLATELQRPPRGKTLYVLDEPTIGLHPADVDRLMAQFDALLEAGNTVVIAEHEMRVAAAADWIIDLGPGAGDQGGRIIAAGTPADIVRNRTSRTGPYLSALL
ncbi:MAG TPA: excinuclease ABC subunit UvrA [Steroidobacteraceae bacterium]|jgi:excinuclease ABC subunit A|nr:excinuclease ABC subunit UvrA [Steroidobacteraceae bacterium]